MAAETLQAVARFAAEPAAESGSEIEAARFALASLPGLDGEAALALLLAKAVSPSPAAVPAVIVPPDCTAVVLAPVGATRPFPPSVPPAWTATGPVPVPDWPADWPCPSIRWALMIAATRPGKRPSTSVQREVLCISTPWRSERIRPASRSTLKCCDSDDFGIVRSSTQAKAEQVIELSAPAMSVKIATRTGSDSAWRMASSRTASIGG